MKTNITQYFEYLIDTTIVFDHNDRRREFTIDNLTLKAFETNQPAVINVTGRIDDSLVIEKSVATSITAETSTHDLDFDINLEALCQSIIEKIITRLDLLEIKLTKKVSA